jgi:CRP-like cAMP-binding protein
MIGQLSIQMEELQQIPAFKKMQVNQLALLAETMVRQTYVPGEIIFMEGDSSRSMWFVYEGHIKIIKQSLNGRIQGLCLLDRNKCFGSCPLFLMANNPVTAQALDNITLFTVPENGLYQLKSFDPNLAKRLLHIYSHCLEHLARVSEGLGRRTVADRINDCLLTHANQTEHLLTVYLTHEQLAIFSGTVREVVTRHLIDLEKERIVQNETGHVILLNLDALLPPCSCEVQNTF